MVPKIHPRGTSFRGLANYVLHDKGRASTTERVEWVRTRNLATQNGHVAWRVMAATAMRASELKARAGIKNTGRKSAQVAMHVTLAWHPEESSGLTKEAMLSAADGAIRALGAEDRQAIIVAHNDEEQPHVHLVITRVSAEDGRMLSSSKEKLRLSKWALDLEKQNGEVLCEQREHNWKARDRSEYTRGKKDRPRHTHELESGHKGRPEHEKTVKTQRELDARLGRETRRLRERHAAEWNTLLSSQRDAERSIRAEAKQAARHAVQEIRDEYRGVLEDLYRAQSKELKDFVKRDRSIAGRARNVLRVVDVRKIFSAEDRKSALTDAYNAISSDGNRVDALKRTHDAAEKKILGRRLRDERAATAPIKNSAKERLAESRAVFDTARHSLVFRHAMEDAANRTDWKSRIRDRKIAYEQPTKVIGTKAPGGAAAAKSQSNDASSELRGLMDLYLRKKAAFDRSTDRQNERDRDELEH